MRMDAIRLRLLVASSMVLALAAGAVAQDTKEAATTKEAASGNFEGREWTFEAHGAYAFPGEVGMDKEPGILVAVSNGTFTTDRLDLIWDRQHVIDTYLRDEHTLIVYFHFAKDGKYKGMSYYFASGDGCGLCYDGAVESAVKIEQGRIHGKIKQLPDADERSWDITFDAPVAPSDYGTPLPAGGGEQGKIYAAYHAALNADTPATLEPLLDQEDGALLDRDAAETVDRLRDVHPTKSYKVTKGFVKGDNALLLVEGETEIMKVHNEVHFVRIDGTWRVYTEYQQVKLGG